MHVCRDIEIHSAGGLVQLNELVTAIGVIVWIDVLECFRCGDFTRVPEGVCGDVLVGKKFGFKIFGQLIECGACVGIFRVAAHAFRWEFVCSQERVPGATGVETRVNVEEGVALVRSV
jgi:hypothetical protein